MADAKVADTKPRLMTLEPGKYWWCACGHSAGQPWCDGAHKASGTGLRSHPFEVAERQQVAICMCKQTGNRPFCDGAHAKLG